MKYDERVCKLCQSDIKAIRVISRCCYKRFCRHSAALNKNLHCRECVKTMPAPDSKDVA